MKIKFTDIIWEIFYIIVMILNIVVIIINTIIGNPISWGQVILIALVFIFISVRFLLDKINKIKEEEIEI